ncbi:MAG: hypothetical protein ACRDBG_17255 [Waterburya sp.]
MPIGTQIQVFDAILDLCTNLPTSNQEVADKWANVADILLSQVVPPSASASSAKSAFISTLLPLTSNPPNGIILLKAAFQAYATALAVGMTASGFTGIPPAVPPAIETLLIVPVSSPIVPATALSILLCTWAKTGQAVLISPPNTVSFWV